MKKLIEDAKFMGIILLVVVIIGGVFYLHFKLWRAEHPDAKTFTYFIHANR